MISLVFTTSKLRSHIVMSGVFFRKIGVRESQFFIQNYTKNKMFDRIHFHWAHYSTAKPIKSNPHKPILWRRLATCERSSLAKLMTD